MSARAWVLNFDADEELARPDGYKPRPEVVARFANLVPRIAGLVPPGDLLVDATVEPSPRPAITAAAHPTSGLAFCPTPRALALLRSAGAQPVASPPLEVLRRVNDRAWSAELGLHLPGARFVRTMAEVEQTVGERAPRTTGRWLLKRAFAFAGRGRLELEAGLLAEGARRWLAAALAIGGVEVAPLCDRLADFGMHGFIARDQTIHFGDPTLQRIDARGSWIDTVRARRADLGSHERAELEREVRLTADALAAAGYFGPFGIDAFRWRDTDGQTRFLPRCEVNARYSMGWAVGMGDRRPDLAQ